MSDKVMKSFEVGRMNPYQFRFVFINGLIAAANGA